MSNPVRILMEEKLVNLFMKKVINTVSRDILLGQIQTLDMENPNFQALEIMLSDEDFMSHYDQFIREKLDELPDMND
jgi:hypothetical protein